MWIAIILGVLYALVLVMVMVAVSDYDMECDRKELEEWFQKNAKEYAELYEEISGETIEETERECGND